MTTSTAPPRPRAVLLGVQLPGIDERELASSLDELARLAKTLGFAVVGRVTQRRARLDPGAVVGAGKLKELAEWTGGSGVVPVGPPQASGDRATSLRTRQRGAVDANPRGRKPTARDSCSSITSSRPRRRATSSARRAPRCSTARAVILAIFQRHAKSREARLQVEIARLAYIAPRLRETGGGRDREGGGIGGRGAGESASELDRRKVRDRIAELRAELASIEREAGTRRKRRAEQNTVALVGYTNAGKSSWMRALTRSDVHVEDKLFATLGTTVRALWPEGATRVLVSDTVGFIKHLPHDLVASFRSTLDEARESDLLLHIADASDPAFEAQIAVTCEVLAQVGAAEIPRRIVLNKADRLDDAARAQHRGRAPRRAAALREAPRRRRDAARRAARVLRARHGGGRARRSLRARSAWSPRRTSAATCSRRPTTPSARACVVRASREVLARLRAALGRLIRPPSAQAPPPVRPMGPELRCAEVGREGVRSDGARSRARGRLVDDHRQLGLHRAGPGQDSRQRVRRRRREARDRGRDHQRRAHER